MAVVAQNFNTRPPAPRAPTSSVSQPSLLDKPVEGTPLADEVLGRAELRDLTLIKHDDAVRVEDGVDAVGDGDDGAVREKGRAQRRLQHAVCLHVHGRRRLVEHQDVGRCQQGACQGHELPLTLREIGA